MAKYKKTKNYEFCAWVPSTLKFIKKFRYTTLGGSDRAIRIHLTVGQWQMTLTLTEAAAGWLAYKILCLALKKSCISNRNAKKKSRVGR